MSDELPKSIFHSNLEETTRDAFDVIHSYFFLDRMKRKRDLEICFRQHITHPLYKKLSNMKSHEYHICLPILYKAISLLIENGYNDYDSSCITFEFQRRNYLSFGEKKPNKDIIWHYDDKNVAPYKVYSIIFYLRKDKTIKGGGLLYDLEEKEEINIQKINISTGDYVVFPGNLYHSPEPSYGFGCRDSIVVFVKRN
jgi:hypothetical protein